MLSTNTVTVSGVTQVKLGTLAIYWLRPTGGVTQYASPVPRILPSRSVHSMQSFGIPITEALRQVSEIGKQRTNVSLGSASTCCSGTTYTITSSSISPQAFDAKKVKHCSPTSLPAISIISLLTGMTFPSQSDQV